MGSNENKSLTPVIDFYSKDENFVRMLELFRKNDTDLGPIDFFQTINSRLGKLNPISVTNLHMYALLSFHFVRYPTKNRRSGCAFIGRLNNSKSSGQGIYFSMPHVLALCNLLLNDHAISTVTVTEATLKKVWERLKNFKSRSSSESTNLQNATFDIECANTNVAGRKTTANNNIGLRTFTPRRDNPSLKRSASPVDATAAVIIKRPKPLKINPKSNKVLSRSKTNYKYMHRVTVFRQAARIKALRAQNKTLQNELSDKKSELMFSNHEMANLEETHTLLQKKFGQISENFENTCKLNKDLNKQLKSHKNEIEYLTNKLFILEELQSDVNAIEDKLDDPNFVMESEVKQINEDFDAGKEFPQIKVRLSLKKINPAIHLGVVLIRQIGRVSLENTMPLFLALANSVFGQNWDLGNHKAKTRLRHALPPTIDQVEKESRRPITENTLPAKSFTRNLEKNILEPAALRSSAEAIKNCDVSTLIYDHLSIKRGKAITVGVMTGNVDPETKQKKSKHMTLAVKQVVDTTAPGTYRSVVEILRLAAAAAADSSSPDDVQKSFKQMLSKLKFQVTDDASQMRPVCEKLNELIKLLGIDGEMIYIHCNAHIVPALDAGVTKVLIDVENFLQISDQMVRSFNQSFHKVSNSTIQTMVRAIF